MRLLRLSAPDWPYVSVAFLALVAAAAGQTLIPGYVGGTIDSVGVQGDGGAAIRGQLLRLLAASLGTVRGLTGSLPAAHACAKRCMRHVAGDCNSFSPAAPQPPTPHLPQAVAT